jgi:phasin family protein
MEIEMTKANTNTDFTKMWTDMKVPSVDFNQLFSLQRRNVEAFTAANQVLMEGAQAVSKRQAELMRDNMEKMLKTSKDVMTSNSPETNTTKQTEFAKEAYENAINGAREISEMVSKSSFEAFDVINKRCAESMEEMGKLAKAA